MKKTVIDEIPAIENFLESNNMNFLFLLLANLEVERLSNLPFSVRKSFRQNLAKVALEHIAMNEIPDYIIEREPEEEIES
ncbi:MAG: hypothetical protein JXB60_00225 [Candidatus Cloacimonetes bacterium]|nr:hypothetical protein [Candidatus Cloacimonadota bacterium]